MRDIILTVTRTALILMFLTNKTLHLGPDETPDQVCHLEPLSLQEHVPDDVQAGPQHLPDIVKLEVDVSVTQRKEDFPAYELELLFIYFSWSRT